MLDGDRGITYADKPAGRLDASSPASGGRRTTTASRSSPSTAGSPRRSGSRSATRSPSTCSAATSPRRSRTCARRVAFARHQLRHGVLAQHLRRRPAYASCDGHLPGRLRPGARSQGSCATPPAPIPTVTSVRVKDALDALNDVVSQLVMAIRGASSIALIASLLVLAGALAAGHRARLYDAVVLKTLGATRARLLGGLRPRIRRSRRSPPRSSASSPAALAALSHRDAGDEHAVHARPRRARSPPPPSPSLVAVGLGLAGTWRILGQKPAPYLRNL